MKKETIDIYICDFCGLKHESKEWMELHERVCSKNPVNMPCSQCMNMVIGFGCICGMDCDKIGGNVLCFKYKKGEPQILQPLTTRSVVLEGNDHTDGGDDTI